VSWWDEEKGSGFGAVALMPTSGSEPPTQDILNAQGIRPKMTPKAIARQTMMELDPPNTPPNDAVSPPFLPRSVASYSDELRQLAREVIADARGKTEFDFVTEIARTLPMRMLGKLLGVPDEDGRWLVRAGDALIGNTDPEFTDFPVDQVDTQAFRLMPLRSPVSQKLFDYAGERRSCATSAPPRPHHPSHRTDEGWFGAF
jgi:hypothetical protein